MDINTKKLKKNAFRVSKVRGLTASRVRVPGGCCNADVMQQVVDIARKYGNGQIHVTTRQGFEIEGIHMEDMDKVNEMLQPIIDNLQINQNEAGTGYSASGTRNVCACIGNRVCPFGNYNTAAFAKRIEKAIFPNDLHFKIALTGCANDCIKARMHDFGIIGMTEPQYDPNRCVSCGACVKGCDKLSVDALKMENYRIVRNEEKCVGCGVCVTKCPTRALTRSAKKYYRLTLMGRTGKKNPRLGEDFLIWADEDTIIILKLIDDYLDDWTFNYTVLDYETALAGTTSGKYDLDSGCKFRTPAREEAFLVSNPYNYFFMNLVVKNDSGIKSLEDMDGKSIAPIVATDGRAVTLADWMEKHPDIKLDFETLAASGAMADEITSVEDGVYDAAAIFSQYF